MEATDDSLTSGPRRRHLPGHGRRTALPFALLLPLCTLAVTEADPTGVASAGVPPLGSASTRVRELINGLSDLDGAQRIDACRKLGALKAEAAAAVPSLVEMFEHRTKEERVAAVHALASIGDAAVPSLLAEVRNHSSQCRQDLAAAALVRMGGAGAHDLVAMVMKWEGDHFPWGVIHSEDKASPGAVTVLTALLRHNGREVRRAAVGALGSLGPDAKPALPALMTALRDPDFSDPISLAGALGCIGAPAVDPLVACLSDSREHVRARAALALGTGRTLAPTALRALLMAARDKDESVRAWAMASLGAADESPEVVAALRHGLADPQSYVRACSAYAAARVIPADPKIGELLAELTLETDPEVAAAARMAKLCMTDECSRTKIDETITRIVDVVCAASPSDSQEDMSIADIELAVAQLTVVHMAIRDPDGVVEALRDRTERADLVIQMVASGGPDTLPVLGLWARAPEGRLRQVACMALVALGYGSRAGDPVKVLLAKLPDLEPLMWNDYSPPPGVLTPATPASSMPDSPELQWARNMVYDGRGGEAAAYLMELLGSPDNDTREQAGMLLTAEGTRALALVTSALDSETDSVRRQALVRALGKLRQYAGLEIPRLAELRTDPDPAVRKEAVLALWWIRDPLTVTVPSIIAALSDQDRQVRAAAHWSLSRLGQAAAPTCLEALHGLRPIEKAALLSAMSEWEPGAAATGVAIVEAATAELSDPDQSVRLAAVDVLGHPGSDGRAGSCGRCSMQTPGHRSWPDHTWPRQGRRQCRRSAKPWAPARAAMCAVLRQRSSEPWAPRQRPP